MDETIVGKDEERDKSGDRVVLMRNPAREGV